MRSGVARGKKIPSDFENRTRHKIRQVVFAKVHKAASSTLQNILLRFAMTRDLDVLLSKAGVHLNELFPKIHPEDLIEQRDRSPTFFATT
ncbi:hypothetical protein RRG08_005367 [Elysia crispata]|uniref:Uncharacterized protein n=1 Tax=Elysia crispata TaxID=231223 RepID=A0AAE1ATK7_9GAST|nr:hypothetical protein RRG08_005367 [Elysia crispata]